MTGGRLQRVLRYVGDERLLPHLRRRRRRRRHRRARRLPSPPGTLATVTAVQPPGRFGALEIEGRRVTGFAEKPHGDGGWINGGFFVLSPEVGRYLDGDATVWEREPLEGLARDGQLSVYQHGGFWQPMDTQRDMRQLQEMWESGRRAVDGSVDVDAGFWSGRRVLVTGHTGFKGSWLSLWLDAHGRRRDRASRRRADRAVAVRADARRASSARSARDVRDAEARDAGAERARTSSAPRRAAARARARSADPRRPYEVNVHGRRQRARGRTRGARRRASSSTSRRTSATRTASGSGPTARTSRWAARTLTRACALDGASAARSRALDGRTADVGPRRSAAATGARPPDPDVMRRCSPARRVDIRNPARHRPWQHVLTRSAATCAGAAYVGRPDGATPGTSARAGGRPTRRLDRRTSRGAGPAAALGA